MRSSDSSTPRTDALCAFQSVMARRDLEEVTATVPEESAEYIRSLSSDQASAVIGEQ
jgi:hypothetical protein